MDTDVADLAGPLAHKLRSICNVLALDADGVLSVCGDLLGRWATQTTVGWQSEISDDNTPIELSVALDGAQSALRVLFEAPAAEPTPRAFRAAALALNGRLESAFGAEMTRFRQVQDLFLPENVRGRFAAWSSVVFARGRRPTFKAYLNCQSPPSWVH